MGPLLSECHQKDRINSEKSDEVNQPFERQNTRGLATRSRTSVTHLQTTERSHDLDIQDYERPRKNGYKRSIYTSKTMAHKRLIHLHQQDYGTQEVNTFTPARLWHTRG